MKQYIIFECDVCGSLSRKQEDIELCQAKHMGLNYLDEYRKWESLDRYAKACTAKLSTENNQILRDLEEVAYKELISFEKEHNMIIN